MKTAEIFKDARASAYEQNIRIWCPEYDTIQGFLPPVIGHYLGDAFEKNILVVGSGTGTEMVNLLHFSEYFNITGVDPSPEMVVQADAKLTGAFPATRWRLVTGLVSDLPQQETYDAALSTLVFHFLPDDGAKLNLIQSVAQRLKPGAPLVFVDIFGEGASFRHNLSLLRAILLARGFDAGMVEAGMGRIMQGMFPISPERVNELLAEAGFEKPIMFTQSLIFGGWVAIRK